MALFASLRRRLRRDDPDKAARRQAKLIRRAHLSGALNRANPHQDMGAHTGRPERPPERYQGK